MILQRTRGNGQNPATEAVTRARHYERSAVLCLASGRMGRRARVAAGIGVVAALLVAWAATKRSTRAGEPTSPTDSPHPTASTSSATARSQSTPRAAQPQPEATPGVWMRARWGAGADELGRDRPNEGNPEAPMSLSTDGKGNVVILDQLNGRLTRFDRHGAHLGTAPLPLQAPQDLALARDGTTVVMDRLVDKSIAVMAPDGKLLGELPLVGKGLEEGGGATGVFVDGTDVWVEREHGPLVRVGDTRGKADAERPSVPGRPSRDGRSYLTAAIIDRAAGKLYVNAIAKETRQHRFTRQLQLPGAIQSIALLDTDASGVIYLGAVVERAGGEPAVVLLLTCLDPLDGRPVGQARLPANTSADETFRELTVLDEGGVLYAHRTEERFELQRHDCR